ncbi:hypothetical protein DFH08DRAFT_1016507 [Mycena albidolilacea]|uniref:Uncharacterized protein n=1 Tax=Mycena albidolilacea TaxID=1033008 RepID=A0AAD7ANU3_9AGAR|nr:hypothetical protein DFH08DRAFT_1016507 [Mycena albidolilacea]
MDMDHENNAQEAFKAVHWPLSSPRHLLLLPMLLLYLFVHLLRSKAGSAAPVSNSPEFRALTDACDDINNCRKLFDIVWGCLATIFACTWVSVHPNVPPPLQSRLALLWRRLKMMLIAVLAPELIVAFAARQFLAARRFSKGGLVYVFLLQNHRTHPVREDYKISTTHGFFVSMGGFVGSSGCPVTTRKQLNDPLVGPELLAAIRSIDAEDIMDKSKGDALSKGLALAQGLWFCMQYFARIHQHLAVTQLEVATLAFAVVNIFIWGLWWGKPLGVQRPIVVGPPKAEEVDLTRRAGPKDLSGWIEFYWIKFLGVIFGDYRTDKDKYDHLPSSSVPSFWVSESDENTIEFIIGFVFECLAGIVFGAIHCAAWNTGFPTAEEMWIWRSCSLSVAATPMLLVASFLLTQFDFLEVLVMPVFLFPLIYVLARIPLLLLPFTTLRSLPSAAFTDVNWSVYIPHL